ncbi:MAG: cytoplasmic protein [Chloroflexi bacterium]|nr:cytoplasmic protein [Chloroflexota bacterium]
MTNLRVLLAGESWITNSTHFKGWDFFSSTAYDTGIAYLQQALSGAGIELEHLPNHLADAQFPNTLAGLEAYDVILLSDIGANTLLLHPDTWLRGQPTPNRLRLLQEWVEQGGGLGMCGGYYSFAGIYGAAKYHRTPVEAVLPVEILPYDDRLETPEGAQPQVEDAAHPMLADIPAHWPHLLGFNTLTLKDAAHLLATINGYPLLAVRDVARGRTLAWASDIGPHWCPEPFATWPGYARLWVQAVEWLAGCR